MLATLRACSLCSENSLHEVQENRCSACWLKQSYLWAGPAPKLRGQALCPVPCQELGHPDGAHATRTPAPLSRASSQAGGGHSAPHRAPRACPTSTPGSGSSLHFPLSATGSSPTSYTQPSLRIPSTGRQSHSQLLHSLLLTTL